MARKTSTTTPASAAAPAEQTATPVVASTEVKPKAPRTVKPKAEVAPVAAAPAPVVADVAAAAPETTDADVEANIAAQSAEFVAKLNQLSVVISALKSEYRALEKKWMRELKAAQKAGSKRKRKTGNRAPSGFVKPTKISDELASFLGKEKGSEMARTDVTREINKYIRSHNLQDAANRRKINPDAKLTALLKLKKTDELTYFNLQRYMSPHFAKPTPVTTTA
jgi:SWIB/MDM2 domain